MLDPIGFAIAIIVAIIGYRYAGKRQQYRTLDGHTLKKLEDSGINTKENLALEFWFYSNNKQAVEQLAEQLQQREYEVYINETEEDPEYVITAFNNMIPELSVMLGLRKEFDKLAKRYGVVYDGWGYGAYKGEVKDEK